MFDAPAALKTATRLLTTAVGGPVAAEAACGTSDTRIEEYANANAPKRFMRVDQVAALERCSAYPHVTAMLAALAGFQLVPQPQRGTNALRDLAMVLRVAGSTITASAEAMADGRVDLVDAAKLLPELQRLAALAAAAAATLSHTED